MSKVGERLRQARENQDRTIAQVSIETRVPQQSLIDLEEGAYHRLPNAVVIKGFIRNYAQYLGLSPDELIELYRQEQGGSGPVAVMPVARVRRTRAYALPSFFWVFFVTVTLIGTAYVTLSAIGLVNNEQMIADAPTVAPVVSTPTSLPTAVATPLTIADTIPPAISQVTQAVSDTLAQETLPITPSMNTRPAGVVVESQPVPMPTPTLEAPIVVDVIIQPGGSEGSWIMVMADDALQFEGTMLPGEHQIFLAQRRVSMRVGNPTMVQVSVNGMAPEVVGHIPRQPVDWSWPPTQ